jgi:hypothetical protein
LAKVLVGVFADADIDDFIELSDIEYGSSVVTNFDHTRWKHIASPLGASTNIRLDVNGKTVGRVLLQPRLIYTQFGPFSTACVTDALIHPAHRSPSDNFNNLMKASGNIPDFSSVYHTSNERSEPFYRKFFRFPQPFSLRGYGLPVRLSGIFFKISNRRIDALNWLTIPFHWLVEFIAVKAILAAKFEISEQLPEEDKLSQLCLKSIHDSGPIFVRSKAYLKWRLIDAPLWSANVYCVERKGKFLGYIATRKLELNGLVFLVIIDFVLDMDMSFFDRMALRLWLIRQAIKSDVDVLFTMINPNSKTAHTCVGFPMISIPDKFLPHATPIFFRENGDKSQVINSVQYTHMTLADLDYF